MIQLLSECSVFLKVDTGLDNYLQITGVPLSELDNKTPDHALKPLVRKPTEITIVRSRIFYAKPSTTAKGLVHAGFKHIHALNRHPYVRGYTGADSESQESIKIQQQNAAHTIKLMMHVFPRQFGLHNVFTSAIDTNQTAQKFHDYTHREDEINKKMGAAQGSAEKTLPNIPKRLKGATRDLVRRLQILHARCSYFELLRHYCPTFLDGPNKKKNGNGNQEPPATSIQGMGQATQAESQTKRHTRRHHADIPALPENKSLVDLACPTACVSAFCQAALSKVIPDGFWGSEKGGQNKTVFLRKVDHFIKLRRFEMISLHEIAQEFKVFDQVPKRISALLSNFYVTESNTHRFQVFYFRHDVWRLIAEPSMSSLKEGMFEEVKLREATRILDSRRLGFSQLRLLPKGTKLRPIMNLRRRQMVDSKRARVLGPSINSLLKPIHTALKFETLTDPSKLGSALFAVGDIYERLKAFKDSLAPGTRRTFYFAKLDVKAAFDTIPQSSVLKLMGSVPSQSRYVISKHAEVKPGERLGLTEGKCTSKPVRRWHSTAMPPGEPSSFLDRLESGLGSKKKNTVFVDSAAFQVHDTRGLLALLSEHVGRNIIKIGKKYYRQKKGIPQGSVLSTFLCNYFYADLEAQHLGFLGGPDSLLLRLVDDFLLITLDKEKAIQFVETMHQGLPEYGVEVGRDKTLVNFDMDVDGEGVRKLPVGDKFPYCGTMIDYSFKYQSHLMFFDTDHNTVKTVLDSLRGAFSETALKMWAYLRCLSASTRLTANLIIGTIKKVVDIAFLILTSKWRKMRFEKYACEIRKAQVIATGYSAFLEVLSRRQTGYGEVIAWLRDETARLAATK
ncbi:telomerase reverse transcriptase [Trichoderma arundinaceum]|uniref:Telomerase reverse transcriptase n=1 Tax=Trichoderma arundinaceum TaxID=490622 RepID=A0A395NHM5_TRIAR|nr:telomerase reverse transcriptase [Trichoderma arundinaceum]